MVGCLLVAAGAIWGQGGTGQVSGSHCFLFGDGRSYCVAIITVNEAESAAYLKQNKLDFYEVSVLARNKHVRAEIYGIVAKANARISSSEQIKRFVILDEDFSARRDEITPTMKLKREVVARNYKDILEKLYE